MGVVEGKRGGRRRLGLWALAVAVACATGTPASLPPEALAPLQGRAERARGLSFDGSIQAQLVARGKVEALLAEAIGLAYSPKLCRMDEELKKALGLLPPEADLWTSLLEFQSEAVVGFYAPLADKLYVVAESGGRRPEALLPRDAEQVLVHELVHALQGIHTDLIDVTLGLLDHDDLAFAIGTLLEGDATWTAYRDEALSFGLPMPRPEEIASEFEAGWSGSEHAEVPRLVRESLVLQYPAGYALVTQIVDAGGLAALDAALLDPPLTSEEVLHPERYLEPAHREPLLFLHLSSERIAPSPACREIGGNTFGEFGLRIWAQERGLPRSEAAAVADGWRSDRAVVFDCPTNRASAWLLEFESAAKAREFSEMARRVARPSTGVDELGTRVLLWRHLSRDGRNAALRQSEARRYRDLAQYLGARPEVLQRTRALRDRNSAGGGEGGGHHRSETRGGEGEGDL